MVSMVIVLFLVAVAISLFFGRLAEVMTKKIKERSEQRQTGKRQVVHVPHAPANKA